MTLCIANKSVPRPASSISHNSSSQSCEEMNTLDNFSSKLIAMASARMARAEKKTKLFTHPALKLFTQPQLLKLQKNFTQNSAIIQHSPETIDFKPVVKLFTPDGSCTWLLTELDPDMIAFGLCDLGFGEPEIGYVDLKEIYALRGKMGLPIERDRWFEADKTLSEYASLARKSGIITA